MDTSFKKSRKKNYCLGCLAVATEGLRAVFSTAVGGRSVFYKVYLGYQYMDSGYIISYDNSLHNLSEYSLHDAVKYLLFNNSESKRYLLSDLADEDSFSQTINRIYSDKVWKYIISGSSTYDCNVFGDRLHFYLICVINNNEWMEKRIPLRLIKTYFGSIAQNNRFFPENLLAMRKKVGDHINAEMKATLIILNVCVQELCDRLELKSIQKVEDFFDFVCNLACKPYEGAKNKGIIKFSTGSFEKNAYIKFDKPVLCTINNAREIRKLLEMTDEENPLIVKKSEAVGIGTQGADMKRAIKIQRYSFFDRGVNDKLQEKIINKFTSIDGALIISPDGVCYAIGVILDGKAVEIGDTGRGARYNSLNNYVRWANEEEDIKATSMAIVVSEDQTIDYLPKKTNDNVSKTETVSAESMTDPSDTYQTSHRDDDDSEYLFGRLDSEDNSLDMTGIN